MPLAAGLLVTPNVRLLRPIGNGSMGEVWVAEHLTLKTDVAVKLMAPSLISDAGAVARFTREATAGASIKSPHVARVYDNGTTAAGLPFMVMELLHGEDLGARIAREGPLDLATTCIVTAHAGKALERAHAAGIVHRDIKPDNLFLTDEGGELFVKLLDFGVAKGTAAPALAMTSTGMMVGTPYYMSPEQVLSAKSATPACDLWSLAVVVYECLTARLPFEGETLGALCVAIDKGAFVAPSRRRPELPTALDAWFGRAFARAPEHRFRAVNRLVESLFRACSLDARALPSTTGTWFGRCPIGPAATLAKRPMAEAPVVEHELASDGATSSAVSNARSVEASLATADGAATSTDEGALGDPAPNREAEGPAGRPRSVPPVSLESAATPRARRRRWFEAAAGCVAIGVVIALRFGPHGSAVSLPPTGAPEHSNEAGARAVEAGQERGTPADGAAPVAEGRAGAISSASGQQERATPPPIEGATSPRAPRRMTTRATVPKAKPHGPPVDELAPPPLPPPSTKPTVPARGGRGPDEGR